jgi:hypothetical protein
MVWGVRVFFFKKTFEILRLQIHPPQQVLEARVVAEGVPDVTASVLISRPPGLEVHPFS